MKTHYIRQIFYFSFSFTKNWCNILRKLNFVLYLSPWRGGGLLYTSGYLMLDDACAKNADFEVQRVLPFFSLFFLSNVCNALAWSVKKKSGKKYVSDHLVLKWMWLTTKEKKSKNLPKMTEFCHPFPFWLDKSYGVELPTGVLLISQLIISC